MSEYRIDVDARLKNGSQTDVQKQLDSIMKNVKADTTLAIDFAKSKVEIQQQTSSIAKYIQTEFNKIAKSLKLPEMTDKQALKTANDFVKQSVQEMKQQVKEQEKLNALQAKADKSKQIQQEKELTALRKEQFEYEQKRQQYKSDGAKQAEEVKNQNALMDAYKQADEYVLREKEYLSQRNALIAEGIKQEKEYNTEASKAANVSQKIANGQVSKDISGVTTQYNGLNTATTSTIIPESLKSDYQSLITLSEKLNTSLSDKEKNATWFEYQNTLKSVKNKLSEVSTTTQQLATEQSRLSQAGEMSKWLQNNSKATKMFGSQINEMIAKLRSVDDLTVPELEKIRTEFQKIQISARETNKIGFSFVDKLKNGLAKFGDWFGISTILMSGVHALGELKDAAFELDGVITDLDMATDLNKEQIKELIGTYSDLGDELNATVTDITTSATEWLKQGKSIADTETLVKDSMILSKVGKLDSAESTKYLTSAMKGYNVEVENTLGIVDKLSAVDMASATDVGGLAEGMSEVANNANLAGISMDKLLGYLATVGEVTQESMPSVGTSFNAIFARMGNIKLSRLKDYQNNGEDLSNVETVLRGEGVALRDSTNSFRNFGEVIDEVAGNWTNYSEVSQRAIASAFAGTYHMEDFLVLMQNYDTAIKYTETSLNSTGTAMEKFNDWQDGMKAHLEQNKNAFIGLSETVMNTDFLKGAVDTGTGFLNVLTVIIDKVGILPTLLTSVGAGLSLKNVGVEI